MLMINMDTLDDLKKDIVKKDAIVKQEQMRLKSEITAYKTNSFDENYFKKAEIDLTKREIEKKKIEKEIIHDGKDITDKSLTTITNNYFYQKNIDKDVSIKDNEEVKELSNDLEQENLKEKKTFWDKFKENFKKIILQ